MSCHARLLLVAATTGYQTKRFVEAASALNVKLVLATDRCHVIENPWGDGAIPVQFQEPEQSAEAVRNGIGDGIDGVLAVGDRPALIAAHVAELLGLRFHSAAGVRAANSKWDARERFADAGMLAPKYRRVALGRDPAEVAESVLYPCVLKPTGLSASRGVIRADTPEEFVAAFRRISTLLSTPDLVRLGGRDQFVVIEDYIPGREFAIEGVASGGVVRILAIFDKPDPLEGPFFEESLYITPSREPARVQRAIETAVQDAVTALGLSDGPIHAECRCNDQGLWMLEVAARPIGGLCAQALRFGAQGESLECLLIRQALGESVTAAKLTDDASGVMMIPIPREGVFKGVSGLEEAAQVPGIWDVSVTAKLDQHLVPLPEGASYLGFLFARGGDSAQVEQSLRNAHAALSFEILTKLPVYF